MSEKSINFEVLSIEAAKKEGFVVINAKYNGNDKVYTYVRRAYVSKTTGHSKTYIDGCRITFDSGYNVLGVGREYGTKGTKKLSTVNQSTTSDKIKAEMQAKEIEVPEVETPVIQQEEPQNNGEVRHEKYDQIKVCLQCGIPVYLAGPAGSGKNHTVEQIAKELGWNFYFSNSVQQEFKLTGFVDAGGKFHETEFYKACTDTKDCIFFLDEMDASIPEVLVLLNAAIANGYFEFPNGRVDFDHVHFVAAGNTVGSGADDMYTGRMVLDQATLDRFAIIEFGYSMRIEMAITHNNTDLVGFIHQLREEAASTGVRATFSYRCMTMVAKLEKAGMDLKVILQIAVFKGLDKDTVNTFNPCGSTKYHKALNEVKMAA